MTMFRVTLERSERAHVYVEADTEKQAIEDAEEVAFDLWYPFNDDVEDVEEVDSPPEGQRYWSGGDRGDWKVA